MNKNGMLKIINPILFISVTIQAMTGMALALKLFIARPKIFAAISEIHEHNGFFFIAVAIVHLYLNWSWVTSQLFRKTK